MSASYVAPLPQRSTNGQTKTINTSLVERTGSNSARRVTRNMITRSLSGCRGIKANPSSRMMPWRGSSKLTDRGIKADVSVARGYASGVSSDFTHQNLLPHSVLSTAQCFATNGQGSGLIEQKLTEVPNA